MASDLSTSYSENPNFDAQSYVEDRERGFARGFVIVLRDGRVLRAAACRRLGRWRVRRAHGSTKRTVSAWAWTAGQRKGGQ